MRTAGVLTEILPETEKWGIDTIPALVRTEEKFGWDPDALLRLAGIVPPVPDRLTAMAERLKMSSAERKYLQAFADYPEVKETLSEREFRAMLYQHGAEGAIAKLRLAITSAVGKGDDDLDALRRLGFLHKLLDMAEGWEKPVFPVKGNDLIDKGLQPGPDMGSVLAKLEQLWIESDFTRLKSDLIATLVH
jgi:poly(A) polymerase